MLLRSTLISGTAAFAASSRGWAGGRGRLDRRPSPPTGQDAYINGIAARTDTDAWAVGSVGQQSNKVGSLPLIDHGKGPRGRGEPASFPATNGVHLGWVSASSAADAWAVGTINLVKHPGYSGPLKVTGTARPGRTSQTRCLSTRAPPWSAWPISVPRTRM